MNEIIFLYSFYNKPIMVIKNIRTGDPDIGNYICDVIIQTTNFQATFLDTDIYEKDIISFRNSIINFPENREEYSFELIQFKRKFVLTITNNLFNNDSVKISLIARDNHYGYMKIDTHMKKYYLKETVKQIDSNIVPMHKDLWL